MKLSKSTLKRIINEEVQKFLNEDSNQHIKIGDYLEIVVEGDEGFRGETSVEEVDPQYYDNTKSFRTSFKALVQVVEIAQTREEY